MFDVFKKLLMARQINFEEGKLELLGQRMIIAPAATLLYIQKVGQAAKQEEFINKLIYYSCKIAGYKGFTNQIKEKFRMHKKDIIKWQTDVAMLGGWGVFKHIKLDMSNHESVIHFVDSPIAKLFGTSKLPVDHAIRGYTAAVAEILFNEPTETIETKCQSVGDKYCEIISKPVKNLNPAEKIIKSQLDLSGNFYEISKDFYEKKTF